MYNYDTLRKDPCHCEFSFCSKQIQAQFIHGEVKTSSIDERVFEIPHFTGAQGDSGCPGMVGPKDDDQAYKYKTLSIVMII